MRRVAALAGAAALSFGGLAASAATETLRNVKVGDNYFVRDGSAPTVSVARNTRVKWLWRGDSPHNVNVTKGPVRFHSKTMRTGSYSKLMTRAGTYKIVCTIHGARDQSMTLRVR
jgi:plastocyanin